jgi:hypothetical protein
MGMSWKTFSLHFKQTFEGGYRYLDRCGEFMLEAVEKLDFISSETKATGAKMEKPEKGIVATIDTLELVVRQDLPEDGGQNFFKSCEQLAELAARHFSPKRIQKNGFAEKLYWPTTSPQAALKASLTLGDEFHNSLAKSIGMIPSRKGWDCHFSSGSMDFHIIVQPVTFEKVTLHKHTADFQASRQQVQRVERLNANTRRFTQDFSHALSVDLDLVEFDPPEQSLRRQFDELKQKSAILVKLFQIS